MIQSKYFANNKNNNLSTYANRGMGLEYDINLSNEYYRIKDVAYIYKKPNKISKRWL